MKMRPVKIRIYDFILTKVNAHNKLYHNKTFVHISVMSDIATQSHAIILYNAHSVYGGRLKLGGNLELTIYIFYGSLVERPYSIRGVRVQSQANITIY
jgi:hypothetical protein